MSITDDPDSHIKNPYSHIKNPYIPEPATTHGVPVPPALESHLSPEQSHKVLQIQLEHARKVTSSLSDSYQQILDVMKPASAT